MKGEDIIKRIITSPDVTPPAVTVDVNGLSATLLVQECYSFSSLEFFYGTNIPSISLVTVTDTMHLEL